MRTEERPRRRMSAFGLYRSFLRGSWAAAAIEDGGRGELSTTMQWPPRLGCRSQRHSHVRARGSTNAPRASRVAARECEGGGKRGGGTLFTLQKRGCEGVEGEGLVRARAWCGRGEGECLDLVWLQCGTTVAPHVVFVWVSYLQYLSEAWYIVYAAPVSQRLGTWRTRAMPGAGLPKCFTLN